MLILCMWQQIINNVKVVHQGEDHIKVKVKNLPPFQFYVIYFVHAFTYLNGLNGTNMVKVMSWSM